MAINNNDVVIIMGKDENVMCKAVPARAHQGQGVLQGKGEPRVAASLAGPVTSRARNGSSGPLHQEQDKSGGREHGQPRAQIAQPVPRDGQACSPARTSRHGAGAGLRAVRPGTGLAAA